MQKQPNGYINSFLSPYLCSYRKGFSTHLALLSLTEIWKKTIDNKGFGGTILMDLSKAFDTINHGLLIAKLDTYGFHKSSLKLLFSYLNDGLHTTNINQNFSPWEELLQSVPQGSVLGPLFFNFADDNCEEYLSSLIKILEHISLEAIEWFQNNNIKLNQDKCHLWYLVISMKMFWLKSEMK